MTSDIFKHVFTADLRRDELVQLGVLIMALFFIFYFLSECHLVLSPGG